MTLKLGRYTIFFGILKLDLETQSPKYIKKRIALV